MPLSKIQTSEMLDTPNLGRRNLLINGGMMVDQRNATLQFNAASGYPCDRWYVGTNAIGTFQYTQSTDAPAGFGNSMKIQCTTADTSLDAGSYNYIMHKLEGNALQSMNSTNGIVEHTISFYAKSSKTGVYTVNIRDEDNGQGNSKSFTVSNANTWERYTLTFPAHSSGKLDNDNLSSYRIYWWFASGTNQTSGTFYNGTWGAHSNPNRVSSSNVNLGDNTSNNFYITGIQMETGNLATDFEHRSFGEELQLCQRYYYRRLTDASSQYLCDAFTTSSTQAVALIQFPVEMRANPSGAGESLEDAVFRHDGGTNALDSFGGLGGVAASKYGAAVFVTTSGLNANKSGFLRQHDGPVGFNFTSEL